jgi:hypothetical protein
MLRGKSKHSHTEEIEPVCGWKNAGLLRGVAGRGRLNGEGGACLQQPQARHKLPGTGGISTGE